MVIFHPQKALREYNTFNIEATARWWVEFSDEHQLRQIIIRCRQMEFDWYVFSGGSNVILTDSFSGVYIHPVGGTVELRAGGLVVADAGVVWDDFVGWCVDRGLWGVECLSYIPGLVGASPVQNIGAYGQEAGDRIEWVEYFDTRTLELVRISGDDCEFGYRSSVFKGRLGGGVAIVVRVAFRLSGERPEMLNIDYGDLRSRVEQRASGREVLLDDVRQAVIEIRKDKLPDPAVLGNAGSFFKNPVVDRSVYERIAGQYAVVPHFEVEAGVKIPAGWLIDTAGWKGRRNGAVGVHQRQALVIVNHGGATAADVLSLAEEVCGDVYAKFGVQLFMEVNIL